MSWRMEVESEGGSDAKYYTESRALCTSTRTLKLCGDLVNTGL